MKIQVIGVHWGAYLERQSFMPIHTPTAFTEYNTPELRTRDEIQDWLDAHAGDFSKVMDFASLPKIPFQSEGSEMFYLDCVDS